MDFPCLLLGPRKSLYLNKTGAHSDGQSHELLQTNGLGFP
jgi:hypothetical protein